MRSLSKLNRILLDAAWGLERHTETLFEATAADRLHRCLFGDERDTVALLGARLQAWRRWFKQSLAVTGEVSPPYPPYAVWRYPFALAHWITRANMKIVGIAGTPGIGKTTLAAMVASFASAFRPDLGALSLSLDDFYFSHDERLKRGLQWRAQPGAHDLQLVIDFIEAVNRGKRPMIPRFDHGSDDRLPPRRADKPAGLVLLEGWLLGLQSHGYEDIGDRLNCLILIDGPLSLAKQRRHGREADLRKASGGRRGFSQGEMDRFWNEVLEPGIVRWMPPLREHADLIIALDGKGMPSIVTLNPKSPGGQEA